MQPPIYSSSSPVRPQKGVGDPTNQTSAGPEQEIGTLLTPFAIAPVMDAVVHARARTRPTMTRILLLLGLACLWVSSPCAAAERRVALVVVAAKYEHAA